jgi:hypothetical protein
VPRAAIPARKKTTVYCERRRSAMNRSRTGRKEAHLIEHPDPYHRPGSAPVRKKNEKAIFFGVAGEERRFNEHGWTAVRERKARRVP